MTPITVLRDPHHAASTGIGPRKSRLAAISLGYKQPKTHPEVDQKYRGRSHTH